MEAGIAATWPAPRISISKERRHEQHFCFSSTKHRQRQRIGPHRTLRRRPVSERSLTVSSKSRFAKASPNLFSSSRLVRDCIQTKPNYFEDEHAKTISHINGFPACDR
jgi:hypothetical protein